MSIEAGCAVVGLLMTGISIVLGLFVANKIAASEKAVLRAVREDYLPRDMAEAKFRAIDQRLDGHLERCHPRAER